MHQDCVRSDRISPDGKQCGESNYRDWNCKFPPSVTFVKQISGHAYANDCDDSGNNEKGFAPGSGEYFHNRIEVDAQGDNTAYFRDAANAAWYSGFL